jgi:rubrerythrin
VEPQELQKHIRTLATVEESDSPMISCYLDLSNGATCCIDEINNRRQILTRSLSAGRAAEIGGLTANIQEYVICATPPRTRGLAVFARAGQRPFWLTLQFEVPLPNWITMGPTPNIYHLVELKDNYDRYVILLTTEASSRIMTINLGSITDELWQSRPELRRRAGHGWSRDQFQDHRRERTRCFINDQIRIVDSLISAGGYGHLVLAGNPRMIAAVRKAMPKRLLEKVVDSIPAGAGDRVSDVVALTLQAFLEHEEQDSQAITERLITQIHTHGLAVAGTRVSMEAIRAGQADFVVVVKSYDPGSGWECRTCGRFDPDTPRPDQCPVCGDRRTREFDTREELVRLAQQQDVGVEVVEHNDVLMSLGGVGCLLRYLAPAAYLYSAA